MNETVKAQWLDALRSGKYHQGYEKLRSDSDGFCCLGVLIDTIDSGAWTLNEDEFCYTVEGGHGERPPRGLMDSLGIPRPFEDHLVELNDSKGQSFNDIADWIERNL